MHIYNSTVHETRNHIWDKQFFGSLPILAYFGSKNILIQIFDYIFDTLGASLGSTREALN